MKFSVFGKWEVVNRPFRIIVTICVTVVTICYYWLKERGGDTFLISTGYALFLFVVGIYATYRNGLVENRFIRRANSYLMLRKLDELFGSKNDYSTIEGMTEFVILFRLFTGRADGVDKGRAIVRESGFCFTQKLADLEVLFLNEEGEGKKEKYRRKLEKKYKCYCKKVKWNILRIENVYGDRLNDYLYSDEQILDILSVVESKIDDIDSRLSNLETAIEEKYSFTEKDRKDINVLFDKVNEELGDIVDRLENGLGD